MDFLSDWRGDPPRPGVPARPGVMARLSAVEQAVQHVQAETRPNGGDSMADLVRKTALDVAALRDQAEKRG